jgi:hypothetical protein
MMKTMLIAAASAGMLAIGSMTIPAPAAAATSVSVSIRTPNFSFSIGRPAVYPKPYRVCKPTFKRVYYKHRGKTHSKLVKTGVHCSWVYPRPYPTTYPYHW